MEAASIDPGQIDFSARSELCEVLDGPCDTDVLRAYLRDIARTNRWTLGYRPTLHWLDRTFAELPERSETIRILDVGCGYGDGLRRIEQWARSRGFNVSLTGLDVNPGTIEIAAQATPKTSAIEWVAGDVFRYEPAQPPHIVLSALVTHHLADDEIVRFVQWMERTAALGWFINDLERSAQSYRVFRIFARIARMHAFVQHDGPISIARSFVPEDWRRICLAAGLEDSNVEIMRFKPGRLCVSRRRPR